MIKNPNWNDPGNTNSDGSKDGLSSALDDLRAQATAASTTPPSVGHIWASATSSACPEPWQWLRMACGELPAAEADRLLSHASVCAECTTRLRLSQLAFHNAPTLDESAELSQLEPTSPAWQHRLAVELAQTPHVQPHRWMLGLPVWVGAGLVTALIVVLSVVLWQKHVNAPERLLAEAYTQNRIFDLRVPGAGFAPVTPEVHLRGSAMDRESPSLLTARADIERQLERTPTDPHWLQLQARANLLQENFDAAIDTLDRLLAAGPVTSSLLVDDALAYFQRGVATGSENDRATALDNLRRADELSPADPVVLFNEALVMEDRGQVMNAVETWNRYLDFERDPHWLAEGRQRLKTLEDKLSQLKTHRSRVERYLATPASMRELAGSSGTLANLDEELSTTLLPRLLDSAFPMTLDRSRGSPCPDICQASRALLYALADSLERNHRDPWLTDFLPPASSPQNDKFSQAAHTLGKAIDANTLGDFSTAAQRAQAASQAFEALHNAPGMDRSDVERTYALQRLAQMGSCYQAAHALLNRHPEFVWIHVQDLTEIGVCDAGPGSASADIPSIMLADRIAKEHRYSLLEMRARNLWGGESAESGDSEDAWRIYLATICSFYQGDYPPFRAFTILSGLAEVEKSTPRVHLELLLQREVLGLLELTQSRELIPAQRFDLVIAAIRAGSIPEAQDELNKAQTELVANHNTKPIRSFLADSEVAMANLYLARSDMHLATATLDEARGYLSGVDDSYLQRAYAAARGQLELASGHPDQAEPILRSAILEEERQARSEGSQNIIFAEQNRDLYAVLAGVWLAQGRPGIDILALWERYRLRILGEPVPACADRGLDCLKPRLQQSLAAALEPQGHKQLLGQIALRDRVLLYHAVAQTVTWSQVLLQQADLLSAAESLERDVASPATSQASIDQAARRLGDVLLSGLRAPAAADALLLLEPDPLLGNVPWPAVETAGGPIGLRFNLEEAPSVLLDRHPAERSPLREASGQPLIVGASLGAGQPELLPEALDEARAVARHGARSNLLLAGEATEPGIAAHLATASILHFAGHATQQDGATRLLLAPTGTVGDKPYLDSSFFRRDPPHAARLVVFSACSTGKTEEGWNHGMGDIVDTLASVGVPEVVATRWQIDSASAVPMMDAFYRGLAAGLTVPQALTAARQSLIRDPRYRHPYYWAAYYASGVDNTDLHEVFHGNR